MGGLLRLFICLFLQAFVLHCSLWSALYFLEVGTLEIVPLLLLLLLLIAFIWCCSPLSTDSLRFTCLFVCCCWFRGKRVGEGGEGGRLKMLGYFSVSRILLTLTRTTGPWTCVSYVIFLHACIHIQGEFRFIRSIFEISEGFCRVCTDFDSGEISGAGQA